jgi:hypothetical protein
MTEPTFKPGDVLLLEHEIPGIPYGTGIFVLRLLTEGVAIVSLVSNDAKGLYAIDNPYTISREDLGAFSDTGERARIQK